MYNFNERAILLKIQNFNSECQVTQHAVKKTCFAHQGGCCKRRTVIFSYNSFFSVKIKDVKNITSLRFLILRSYVSDALENNNC